MLVELTFWQKLLNKDVDIVAGIATSTISASIIAGIATLTWSWKLRRDLRHEEAKQRQQHRIAQQLAEEDDTRKARNRESGLRLELECLVDKFREAGSCGNARLLQDAWDDWLKWLLNRGLLYLPANQKIINSWANLKDKFQDASSQQAVSQWAQQLVAQVEKTDVVQAIASNEQTPPGRPAAPPVNTAHEAMRPAGVQEGGTDSAKNAVSKTL